MAKVGTGMLQTASNTGELENPKGHTENSTAEGVALLRPLPLEGAVHERPGSLKLG